MTTWDESMATGEPHIDEQHRRMLALIDEFEASRGTQYDSVSSLLLLQEAMSFAVEHFLMEEDLMRRVHYPPRPTKVMIEQHIEFKHYARMRVLEFRGGESACIPTLQDFLVNWLVTHEFGLDRELAAWIRQNAPAD